MIILKKRVAGYNNVLTIAIKFGVNEDINYVKPSEDNPVKMTTQDPREMRGSDKTTPSVPNFKTLPLPKTPNETVYLLGSAVTLGFLVARYVI